MCVLFWLSLQDSRQGRRATPLRDEQKNNLPTAARRLLTSSSPGTGRVLRPRTPRSYKFAVAADEDGDLYHPDDDMESTDDEEFAAKKTPTRKTASEVCRELVCLGDLLRLV